MTRSGSVLMNSPTMRLDAGDLRRPARHRDAEHHVVAAGQTAKQNRPGGLDEGVERQTLRRACWVSAAVSVSLTASVICSGATSARPGSCGARRVASSSPAKASRQVAMAAARSCAASQAR